MVLTSSNCRDVIPNILQIIIRTDECEMIIPPIGQTLEMVLDNIECNAPFFGAGSPDCASQLARAHGEIVR